MVNVGPETEISNAALISVVLNGDGVGEARGTAELAATRITESATAMRIKKKRIQMKTMGNGNLARIPSAVVSKRRDALPVAVQDGAGVDLVAPIARVVVNRDLDVALVTLLQNPRRHRKPRP